MSSQHQDPEKYGTQFGSVVVTVDHDLGDCVIHAKRKGPTGDVPYRKRFNSIEEISGAYEAQAYLARGEENDLMRALRFAVRKLSK
ncbi:MAG: hypothetical protein EP336_09420 [Rhodobacteraceae bacterium]|nr:MAG: hypothetical protein EP336_09420 [Paracoccaceae bacterium]